MAWKFFNSSGEKKIDDPTYGFATIAAASSIAIANNTVNSVTGTTTISSMTGGTPGRIVALQASGQANGDCLILANGIGSNNLSLRDNQDFGIYAGESVTFQYDGFIWNEVNRNVRTIIQTVRLAGAIAITATTSSSANSGGTLLADLGAISFDGSTPISIEYNIPYMYTSQNISGFSILKFWQTSPSSIQIGSNFQYQQPISTSQEMYSVKNSYRFTPAQGSATYRLASYRDTATATQSAIQAGTNSSGGVCTGYLRVARSLPYV